VFIRDVDIAVGRTGVIRESRFVRGNIPVDHRCIARPKKIFAGVLTHLPFRCRAPRIFDDARSSRDEFIRKKSTPRPRPLHSQGICPRCESRDLSPLHPCRHGRDNNASSSFPQSTLLHKLELSSEFAMVGNRSFHQLPESLRVVEFTQVAELVHDDVVAEMRRQKGDPGIKVEIPLF